MKKAEIRYVKARHVGFARIKTRRYKNMNSHFKVGSREIEGTITKLAKKKKKTKYEY